MTSASVRALRLDDPNQISGQSGWDIDFRQIERGAMTTRVMVRPGDNVTLLELQMSRGVHQRGLSPRAAVTFGFPVTPALKSFNGTDLETETFLNFGTAAEFDAVNSADFVGLTVTVSEPFLSGVADRLGCDPTWKHKGAKLSYRASELSRLRGLGRSLLYQGEAPFDAGLQDDFVAGIVCAMDNAERRLDGTLPLRTKSVQRAVHYIREHAGCTIPVSELCAVTGVSWRTLDRGFREQFGLGPKAYLNRIRLAGVRSDLARMDLTARVADAANKWGFWHMGQFAKDYFRMFGELPSQTLRRRS